MEIKIQWGLLLCDTNHEKSQLFSLEVPNYITVKFVQKQLRIGIENVNEINKYLGALSDKI